MKNMLFGSSARFCLALWLFVLLTAVFARAETFDWSDIPEIHPGIQHVLIATDDIPALPENNQWQHINVLRIDLTEPSIRFYTTPRAENWGDPIPPNINGDTFPGRFIRTVRQRNWEFMMEARAGGKNMVASVNAAPWSPWNPAHEDYADNLGLTVSAGVLVSVANNRPSLAFDRNWTGRLQDSPTGVDISDIELAVSGFQYVLRDGVITATGTVPQPRTGYGISQDGRYLYWMTIDGRINLVIDGASRFLSGASHRQVGQMLQYLGAWNGLNMDGGYSTQMTTWDTQSGQLVQRALTAGTNLTFHRRNGNNLGIYLDTRPPAVGRAPGELSPVLPRNREVEVSFEVSNEGGNVLSYTLASDADWVVVPAEELSVKGSVTQSFTLNTEGMTAGLHEATVTIVNAEDPADMQTLNIHLEVTPEPEDLPIVYSFETKETGSALAGLGGWTGQPWSAEVVEEAYTPATPPGPPLPEAARTRVAHVRGGLSHGVNAPDGEAMTVDLMLRLLPGNLRDPAVLPPQTQTAFAVDAQGELHVLHRHHDGTAWVRRWTPLGFPPVFGESWVRVSVDLDYATSPQGDAFFRPRINGSMYPTASGYRAPDDLRTPGPWYRTANSPGSGGEGLLRLTGIAFQGGGALDDVVIRSAAQAAAAHPEWMGFAHSGETHTADVPLQWFDRWGLRRDPAAASAVPGRTVADAFWSGTDPRDPDQVFRATGAGVESGRLRLRIHGNDSGSDLPFRLQRSLDLRSDGWEFFADVPRGRAPEPTEVEVEIGDTDSPQFFRVLAPRGPAEE